MVGTDKETPIFGYRVPAPDQAMLVSAEGPATLTPLAQAQREVIAMQTDLAHQAAELRQQQLVAEVVKPAEADAARVRALAHADADADADADAEKMLIQAEAAASNNRVALDRMLIDQLPQIVKEAAHGLAGANVNILNGAGGLSEMAAGLVSQGLTILDSVKRSMNGTDPSDPRPPRREPTGA